MLAYHANAYVLGDFASRQSEWEGRVLNMQGAKDTTQARNTFQEIKCYFLVFLQANTTWKCQCHKNGLRTPALRL